MDSTPRASKVAVIGTGGTIAGEAPDATQGFRYTDSVMPVASLVARLPKTAGMPELICEQLGNTGSEDFNDRFWLSLARRVEQLAAREDVGGIVITQGTDTIEETACFLDLVLGMRKPVVVTGAMRPLSAIGSDAPLNLYQSIMLASLPAAAAHGVLVHLNERIHAADGVVKTNTFSLDSFQSPELGLLGYMLGGEPVFLRCPHAAHARRPRFPSPQDSLPRVDLCWAYAGITADVVESALARGARGIVYAGTGNGSVAREVKPALAAAVRAGCAVVRASRTGTGIVTRNAAENDDDIGSIAAHAVPAVKARILLQLALTVTSDAREIQSIFYHGGPDSSLKP